MLVMIYNAKLTNMLGDEGAVEKTMPQRLTVALNGGMVRHERL